MNVAFLGTGAMYLASGFMPNIWYPSPVFFVGSLFVAAFRPVGAAMITSDVEADFRGRAFALQTSASTVGALFGPLLAGFIADHYGRNAVFITIGVLLVLVPWMLKGPHRRAAAEEARQQRALREGTEAVADGGG